MLPEFATNPQAFLKRTSRIFSPSIRFEVDLTLWLTWLSLATTIESPHTSPIMIVTGVLLFNFPKGCRGGPTDSSMVGMVGIVEALADSAAVKAAVGSMVAEALAGSMVVQALAGPTAAEVSAVLSAGTAAGAGVGIGKPRLFNLKFISR